MIANLPMYDRPETRAAYDRLWALIRDALRHRIDGPLPETLTHTTDLLTEWRAPDLLLGQTCGLPYRAELHGTVALVGTPDYGLPGCSPGHYNSVIVMRRGAVRSTAEWPQLTLAINGFDSQSGWVAPVNHAASFGTRFGQISETGGHRASARAVAEGRADIAAIDAQTWRMITRWDDTAHALTEIARTDPVPGLPLITAYAGHRDTLRNAFAAALGVMTHADRDIVGIKALADIPAEAYLAIPTPAALQSA